MPIAADANGRFVFDIEFTKVKFVKRAFVETILFRAFPPPIKYVLVVMFPVEYRPNNVPTLVMFEAFTLYRADPSPETIRAPEIVILGGGVLSTIL